MSSPWAAAEYKETKGERAEQSDEGLSGAEETARAI